MLFDWNSPALAQPARAVQINDETLRDGLQSPSVREPPVASRRDYLHHIAALGVDAVCLGMPASGAASVEIVRALLREIRDARLPLAANVAGRSCIEDVAPVADLQQSEGVPLEIGLFVGASPLRLLVEGWELADTLRRVRETVAFARRHEVAVMMVTEDSTRSSPDLLRAVYDAALAEGARAICLADTCGHATPAGAARVVAFARELAPDGVRLDWHGHNDRGLALASALAAIDAGADRVHATMFGVGERCGNVALEQLLVNLHLLGLRPATTELRNLPALAEMCESSLGISVPSNQPMLGRDAFRTATGVHAAALLKARAMGPDVEDTIYSGVPAALVGRGQEIEIGPHSGRSNVLYWLARHGIDATRERVARILTCARESDRCLSSAEIRALLEPGTKRQETPSPEEQT